MLQTTISGVLSVDRPHYFLHSMQSLSDLIDFSLENVVRRNLQSMLVSHICECSVQKREMLLDYTRSSIQPNSSPQERRRPLINTQVPCGEPVGYHGTVPAYTETASQSANEEKQLQSRQQPNNTVIDIPKNTIESKNAFAHEVCDRVCLAHNIDPFKSTRKFRCFRPDVVLQHPASADDFAAANAPAIARFIELLDSELAAHPSCKVVYCAVEGRAALADAVVLVGAYVMAKQRVGAEEVVGRFGWLRLPAESGAAVVACWRAVDASNKARRLGRTQSLWAGGAAGRRGSRRAFLPGKAMGRSRSY